MFKILKKTIAVLLFLFCSSFIVFAQETADISFDRDSALVGDIINIKVRVELPQNASISANQTARFTNFDILSSDIKHISSNPNIYELDFKASAFKTGILQIEPAAIFYINPDGSNNIFFTPQTQFEIKSIIGSDEVKDIKDIKPLKKFPIKTGWLLLIIALAAICILLAIPLYKEINRLRKKAKEP
ncbi:MAG: hypothetical protein LBN20_03645, partial [Endomicrobium sp.]|nr:hypothetical protein [Endomicrobium sp.]